MEIPKILEKYRDYLESTYAPANEIILTLEETKPWESKLGGCPYLEDISEYPMGANGRPMIFYAQINLEEMEPLPDFPTEGLLQFYVEDAELYGLDEVCKVRYVPAYKKETEGLVQENPYKEQYEDMEPFDKPGKISFSRKIEPIGTECEEFQEKFYDKVTEEEWDALYEFCDASGCKVGGYPYFVQNPALYYEDGTADVLLLQLDIEETCGIMFGDSGNCNFFISREDLRNRNFSDVEYDWQCC